jgi:galactokinase
LPEARRAVGPGRVNLIGDHTDYNHGVALPLAVGLGVTVTFTPTGSRTLEVASSAFAEPATVPLADGPGPATDPASFKPAWARLVVAVAALCHVRTGGTLTVESTLPVGSGLSSSAAVSVALAEVFGGPDTAVEIARLCQLAEHAVGVPVGLMDPLVCAGGRAGHALLIDFDTLDALSVPIPADVEIVVVDSGQSRTLQASEYATRVAECRVAEAEVGPLGRYRPGDLAALLGALDDPVLRRRARHVVTECSRVRDTADALMAGDLAGAGALLSESHRSLAHDFAVTTPALDGLVAALSSTPGVFGARMTGAGFGGCVVALTRPGAVDTAAWPTRAWAVRAADGTVAARV